MRRAPGAVLLALGTFLIVVAVAMPLYVAPSLVKVPLDQESLTVSKAQNATVFDFPTLSERSGVGLTAIRSVRGDVKAGNTDRAVFEVGVRVTDDANKEITVSTDRVALDRRTAKAVACCGEMVNGTPYKHEGLSYTFPFGTEKTSYPFFDTTVRKAVPIEYVATERLQGLEVYKFQMKIDPVQVGEIQVPGSMVGATEPTVTAGRFYSNTRTVWVEPASGVIVRGQEEQAQTLRGPDGSDRLTIIRATLGFTEDTQKKQADVARDARTQINLVTVVLPLVIGGLGVLLLLLGFLLIGRAGRAAALAGAGGSQVAGEDLGRHRADGGGVPAGEDRSGPITDVLPAARPSDDPTLPIRQPGSGPTGQR